MLALERRLELLQLLKKYKSVSIAQLAKEFYISEATIRRDLEKLEKQGQIKRTYGGAMFLQGMSSEIPIEVREKEHIKEKDTIGRLAAQFIKNSDIIMMDPATTTLSIVKYLDGVENLTVITNGIKTATQLAEAQQQNVYCCGGKLRENGLTLLGHHTEEFIKNYNAGKFFFSCRTFSYTEGPMDFSDDESRIKQVMISRTETVFLLCDSSKINKKAFCRVCPMEDIDYFITDQKPEPELMSILDKHGIKAVFPE